MFLTVSINSVFLLLLKTLSVISWPKSVLRNLTAFRQDGVWESPRGSFSNIWAVQAYIFSVSFVCRKWRSSCLCYLFLSINWSLDFFLQILTSKFVYTDAVMILSLNLWFGSWIKSKIRGYVLWMNLKYFAFFSFRKSEWEVFSL